MPTIKEIIHKEAQYISGETADDILAYDGNDPVSVMDTVRHLLRHVANNIGTDIDILLYHQMTARADAMAGLFTPADKGVDNPGTHCAICGERFDDGDRFAVSDANHEVSAHLGCAERPLKKGRDND